LLKAKRNNKDPVQSLPARNGKQQAIKEVKLTVVELRLITNFRLNSQAKHLFVALELEPNSSTRL
jgi:hypothetical protein